MSSVVLIGVARELPRLIFMVCSRPSTFYSARLVAALIGITLVFDSAFPFILESKLLVLLLHTVARPIILFAVATVAAVAAGAGVVAAVTTTTLASLLLVLLLLIFELLLKLFDLMNGVVVLLVAARAPTLAAIAARIGGPVDVVDC